MIKMKHIIAFGVAMNVASIYMNVVCLVVGAGPAWLRVFFMLASVGALWLYKHYWYDLTH